MSRADGPTLTTISWEDKGWLQHFPLNRDTVLDYFALSQFYDRTCNNEQLKMQRGAGTGNAAIAQLLEQMSGVEYVLHEAQEVQSTPESSAHSLYVIRKQRREGEVITVLRMYYVLDGTVYEAPTLEAVLRTRLLKLGWLLDGAFSAIKDAFTGGAAAAEGSGSAEAAGSEAGGSVSGAREAAGGGAASPEPDARENADEPRAKRARST